MRQWDRFHSVWPDALTSGSPAAPASLSARWTPQKAARAQNRPHFEAYLERETEPCYTRLNEIADDHECSDHYTRWFFFFIMAFLHNRTCYFWLAGILWINSLTLGFSFRRWERQRAVWLCKWIVANSPWAERVSSHSGVICYINPLLTQKAATVQLQPQGNAGDWAETPDMVVPCINCVFKPTINWYIMFSLIKLCFPVCAFYSLLWWSHTHTREQEKGRHVKSLSHWEAWNQISLLCNVL